MSGSVTLDELRDGVRDYTDTEHDTHITDAKLDRTINRSLRRYQALVERAGGEHYFRKETTITTASGTASYEINASENGGVKWIYAVWWEPDSSSRRPLFPLQAPDAHFFGDDGWGAWEHNGQRIYYLRDKNDLVFFPTPDSVETVKVWYSSNPTKLVNAGDTFDFNHLDGDEWVILDVAIRVGAFMREEDRRAIFSERSKVEKDLLRDVGADKNAPPYVRDLSGGFPGFGDDGAEHI